MDKILGTLTKKDVLSLFNWILGRSSCTDDLDKTFPDFYSSANENKIFLIYQIYVDDFYKVKKRSIDLNNLLQSTFNKDILKNQLNKLILSNEHYSINLTHPFLHEFTQLIGQLTKANLNDFYETILKMKHQVHLRDKVHLKNALEIVRELQQILCDNKIFYEYKFLSDFEDALEYRLNEETLNIFNIFKKVF